MSQIVTTYLEIPSYNHFRPAYLNNPEIEVKQVKEPLPAFYRFLYSTVGRDYEWIDRLHWRDEYLHRHLSSPSVSVWVAYYRGTPAGYIELQQEAEETGTEVAYFGLISAFQGQGLGKHLLSFGLEQAWQENPTRVWLHTCSLDGPHALSNYQKRGFSIYKQIIEKAA